MAELQLATTTADLATRLLREYVPQHNYQEVDAILNSIVTRVEKIYKTEAGKGLLDDFKKLGKKVSSKEGFLSVVANFFHLAKKWFEDPTARLVLFLLCTAGLIAFICVSESKVAVWVASLLCIVGGIFVNARGCLTAKIAELFARSSLL